MTDRLDRRDRSLHMAKIRGRDTRPEMALRSGLHSLGFRYRLHVRGLPGRPDIVFPQYRAVVFVHGCFWHRHENCKLAYSPKSRVAFWTAKFRSNVLRDAKHIEALQGMRWRVLIVWECAIRHRSRRLG